MRVGQFEPLFQQRQTRGDVFAGALLGEQANEPADAVALEPDAVVDVRAIAVPPSSSRARSRRGPGQGPSMPSTPNAAGSDSVTPTERFACRPEPSAPRAPSCRPRGCRRIGDRLFDGRLPLGKPSRVGDVVEDLLRRASDLGAVLDDFMTSSCVGAVPSPGRILMTVSFSLMSEKSRRTYDGTRRREQAARTRARDRRGGRSTVRRARIQGTTIPAIAAEAGVAVETVYRSATGKAGLLADAVNAPPWQAAPSAPKCRSRSGQRSVASTHRPIR